MSEQHPARPSSEMMNRRQAMKLAAGAGALASVLGVPLATASQRSGRQGLQSRLPEADVDRLQYKLEFSSGADRGEAIGSVYLPEEVVEHLAKGDLTQLKVTWYAKPAGEKEARRVVEHGLDPKAIEALKALQERLR